MHFSHYLYDVLCIHRSQTTVPSDDLYEAEQETTQIRHEAATVAIGHTVCHRGVQHHA